MRLNINYKLFFITFIGSLLLFPQNLFYVVALSISIYHFVRLFQVSGDYLPVIEYTSVLFAINFLLVPVIMYEGLNNFVVPEYQMKIAPEEYFTYVIPCMLAYYLGLNWNNGKSSQKVNITSIKEFVDKYPYIPLLFIGISVLFQLVSPFVPADLEYLFFIISNFKHVGLYLLILAQKKINPIYFVVTVGSVVYQAFSTSMFNDMLNLIFFLGMILAIRYKPKPFVKVIFLMLALLLVNFIQTIKFQLRSTLSQGTELISTIEASKEQAAFLSAGKSIEEIYANKLMRLNQAWVTTSSINKYKADGFELQNGMHFSQMLLSAFLPRLIYPDKLNSGDIEIFNKYSGQYVAAGSSFALGVPTDGFIDFGFVFGWITPLLLGLVINYFLRLVKKLNKKYLIFSAFIPIIFYYSIRPDCELQTTLGSLFKTTFTIWFLLYISALIPKKRGYSIKQSRQVIA